MTSFSASVSAWAAKSQKRMEAIVKESAQRVGSEVIDRTPVDTGFLRGSFIASTSEMPLIDRDARPAPGGSYDMGTSQIALVIAGSKPGDVIRMGFVASYAAHVEYGSNGRAGRGMVRLSAQRWPQIVAEVVQEAKARIR